jgi:molecular chaperone Hsp33
VHRLFHEEQPQLLGEKPLRFACSCSRERVESMLVSLGEPEVQAAVEAGLGEAQDPLRVLRAGISFRC